MILRMRQTVRIVSVSGGVLKSVIDAAAEIAPVVNVKAAVLRQRHDLLRKIFHFAVLKIFESDDAPDR